MKISIDTAQDSKEEIRKAIKLLQAIAEGDNSSRSLFDSPNTDTFGSSSNTPETSEATQNAFNSMFGDDAPAPSTSVEVPEKKDKHKVELY